MIEKTQLKVCKHGHEHIPDKRNRCGRCHVIEVNRYRSSHPDTRKIEKLRQYGIKSLEEREAILASQGGRCAICLTDTATWSGKGFNNVWHVDHKHGHKKSYRGILCAKCNLVLGKVKDSVPLLKRMIEYLEAYDAKHSITVIKELCLS